MPVKNDESRLELLSKATREIIRDWDIVKNTIWWNSNLTDVLQHPAGSLTDYTAWFNAIHPDDQQNVGDSLKKCFNDGDTNWSFPYRFENGKGQYISVVDRAYITYEYEKPIRMVASITERTSQVNAGPQVAMAANLSEPAFQNRYQQAFNNASLAIVVSDVRGNFITFNHAFAKLTGYTQEELYRDHYSKITHPDDIDASNSVSENLLNHKLESSSRNKRYVRKDKSVVWVNISASLIEGDAEFEPSFFAIIRDITQDVALKAEQQKLLSLVENSLELMSILELDGTNSYINKAGRELLGFDDEQQVLETPIRELHPPEHFVLVENEVLPSLMEKGRWTGQMMVKNIKSGAIFPVQNNTIRIDDPKTGKPLAIGAVMRDLRPEIAAREALLHSEKRFRHMIMQAPVAICLFQQRHMVIESANTSMLAVWGKTEKIIGLPVLHALPEIKDQGFMELLQGVYDTGVPYYGNGMKVLLFRNNQMDEAYFNFVYAPTREADNTISGVMAVATEVTDQIIAKEKQAQSEKRFRDFIMSSPTPVGIYMGRDMVIQIANEAMLKTLGRDESILGLTLKKALPELEGQPFLKLLDDVYTTGVAYQATEDRADLLSNGKLETFYFNFTYKPLLDEEGKVYGVINTATDVSDLVRAKHQLNETEESLRSAVEIAELATWEIMANGDAVFSPRCKAWFGFDDDGNTTLEMVLNLIPEREKVKAAIEKAFERGAWAILDIEYISINQKTLHQKIIHSHGEVIIAEGALPKLRGISQDVTTHRQAALELERLVEERTEELERTNSHLKQINNELEQFAYVASHDLQEPLRKIRTFSGLLKEDNHDKLDAAGQGYLLKITNSAERMSNLIRDVLYFSRVSSKDELFEKIDLNVAVKKVEEDFELLISQKRAVIKIETLPVVEAIPLQVNQLFYNLISNALKFTNPAITPVITISSHPSVPEELNRFQNLNPSLSYYTICIADNGIGFDPSLSEKIFTIFQRLNSRDKYEGTGIGLALCKKIMITNNGNIYSTSEEGQGANFNLLFPLKQIKPREDINRQRWGVGTTPNS